MARIEELERENKKLAKDVADAEKRWQKAEEALADAGGGDGGDSGLVEKLVSCATPRTAMLFSDLS